VGDNFDFSIILKYKKTIGLLNHGMFIECMINQFEKKILDRVVEEKSQIIDLVKDFVSLPTENPPGLNYKEMVKRLERFCNQIGCETEIIDVPHSLVKEGAPDSDGLPRQILLAYLVKKNSSRGIHFNGHYDVVPASGSWKISDPYKPIVVNGEIYGRGTTDMKGPLVSILIALKVLSENKNKISGNISFSAVPDEEIGGLTGTGYLLDKKKIRADTCIVAEPSGIGNIWDSHKGQAWFEVVVKGKAAHGATPWLGENAFERASRLAVCLFDKNVNTINKKNTETKIDDSLNIPTTNIGGVVKGGTKINIVPDFVSFTIDRRILPKEKIATVKNEVKFNISSCSKKLGIPKESLKLNLINYGKAAVVRDPTVTKELSSTVEDISGYKPTITLCNGGLDMRYFEAKGISTVSYGPGNLGAAHMADESVNISDLILGSQTYVLYSYRRFRKSK